jgi:hypothetical protein
MKPVKNIEEFVKLEKPHVTTGGTMDEQILNDSFAAMDETIRADKPSAAGIILRSRAAKLAAAAAVIIMAISFFISYQGPSGKDLTTRVLKAAESPSEMLTMKSLTIAFRKGDIEGLENQCEKAIKILGPQPASLSLADLFNGPQS